ncbi:MAG: pyruvate dehydrogenase complex dihydrolipoamide acetyltransferase, partial [Rhodospirillaceae bacterium]|nr:pyruvate dehydrogenase complex dihydrolipoamide acetyltransferase [Rhodospirillaceae bacterium]
MPIEILMPALSPTMTEGNLVKWHKQEGQSVKAGEVLAEIETDKATMEVEAVDEGTLGKILVPAGAQGVKVNAVIAVLLREGEDKSALASAAPAAAAPAALPPVAASKAPVQVPAPPPAAGGRIAASPLARRLAAQARIDLAAIKGSGPHGRIVKADVEAARRSHAPMAAVVRSEADGGLPAYRLVPHSTMRRVIARRLTEAKQTVPHYYLSIDCRIDALLKMRE